MVADKTIVEKSAQFINTSFQSPTKATSGISKPNTDNIGTTERLPHAEVTEISPPTSSTLIPDIIKPLQVPAKTIRSNPGL